MGFFTRKKPAAPPSPLPKLNNSRLPSSSPAPVPAAQPSQRWHPQNGPPQQHGSFQPAGYLPGPSGWNSSQSTPPPPYQDQRQYAPIVVNQHYYLNAPPSHQVTSNPHYGGSGCATLGKLKLGSAVDLANELVPAYLMRPAFDDGLPRWHSQASQLLNQGAAMYDQISSRFNDIMTLVDGNRFDGNEKELFTYQPMPATPPSVTSQPVVTERGMPKKSNRKDAPKGQTTAVASSLISGSYFAKVELYANSRLPMDLPPLRLYIPTYPLLCLAAQYADKVYDHATGAERDAHVESDWKTGTKAMCIKSVPMDHMNTIVFAIRGTATFMDWAVNLNMAPTSPSGFLDDPGNFCHAGFLASARKMIKPVAARLRQLLEENPHRSSYSLMITGHSAGGAVAALLYSHMLSTSKSAASELNLLTNCFKRVHCVTFGSPPVSLLPLTKPNRPEFKKSLFLSFVNEGDPVARADKAYVKSLLDLLATPAPGQSLSRDSDRKPSSPPPSPSSGEKDRERHSSKSRPREKKSKSSLASKTSKASMKSQQSSHSVKTSKSKPPAPVWPVPPSTLSSAGRIVVLRSGDLKARPRSRKTVEDRLNEGVIAQIASDEQLRGVIWGDPVCHVMRLYKGRIETLAVGAVTARGY